MSKKQRGIDLAVRAAGTQALLAQSLGVSQQAINIWTRQGWCPIKRAIAIEEIYKIPRAVLANPRIMTLLTAAPPAS